MEKAFPPNRATVFPYANGDKFRQKPIHMVFTEIYRERLWDEQIREESISGAGSSQEQTRELVRILPWLFRQYGIRTVLDIPCGDFNWMQAIAPNLDQYVGADIVPELIAHNQQTYSSPNIQFLSLNLITDPLPPCDLIFCRDCLVHFSFEHIRQALINIQKTACRYLLTTTFPGQVVNEDIVTGGWRPLNLEIAPFHFPPPLEILNEKCSEKNGLFQDKSLGLWEISQL